MANQEKNRGLPEESLVRGIDGATFIKTRHNDRKAPLQVEAPRPDELTRPNLDEAADRLAEGPTGRGGFPKGRKRRTKLAVLGIPAGALDSGDPSYARCVRLAAAYRKCRTRELAVVHGYVSSGASALLASAAMALSASRYLYEKAASGGEETNDLLKTAAKLADSARQNELAAWELCAREAVAKKKATNLNSALPWLLSDESGNQRMRPGPKKKAEPELILPPVGSPLEGWVQSANLDSDGPHGPKDEAGGGTPEA